MTIENELKNYLSNTIGTQVAISKAGFGGMGTILIMELSNHYHLWVKCAWQFFAHTYEFDYNWEFRIPNEKLIFQLTNHCKIKKKKVTQ